MLELRVGGQELYDEVNERFVNNPVYTLKLEHSLLSISKWESKWKVAFLDREKAKTRTMEMSIDYIRCMTINKQVDERAYSLIGVAEINRVNEYIDDQMTATWFAKQKQGPPSRKIITSEVIYYWMISNNIPFECEKWHLNRLLTLIRVCEAEQAPHKKMSQRDLAARNHSLNKARRAKHGSRG